MSCITQLGITIAILFLVYYAINVIVANILHLRCAQRQGCKPPPRAPQTYPFGIDILLRLAKADKTFTVPQAIQQNYTRGNADTFSQSAIIVTQDPENVKAMLATQFKDFELGPTRRLNFVAMLGDGIFTLDGEQWAHSRAMLRPQFARDQVADLDLEETHVQNLLRHFCIDVNGWTVPLDLSPMFFRLTIDSATEFFFGESINSQVAALPAKDGVINPNGRKWANIAAAFDRGTLALSKRARLMSLYWLHNPKSFQGDCRLMHAFADDVVDRALERMRTKSLSQESKRYVFLDEIIKVTQDRVEIRSQLLNILVAGRDTTAGLLGWTFWTLARHPEVYKKLRKTVLDAFGTFESPEDLDFASLKSCTYLQNVMNEVLRLYPSVPMNFRQATRDTTLPRGGGKDGSAPIYVRKGQTVDYSVYVMQRRKDLWGPDAEEFNPDRFVGRKHGWEYLPFNGGPRICLGQQFALTEAGYVIVRIVQRYSAVEKADDDDVARHAYSITTAPKNAWVRFRND